MRTRGLAIIVSTAALGGLSGAGLAACGEDRGTVSVEGSTTGQSGTGTGGSTGESGTQPMTGTGASTEPSTTGAQTTTAP